MMLKQNNNSHGGVSSLIVMAIVLMILSHQSLSKLLTSQKNENYVRVKRLSLEMNYIFCYYTVRTVLFKIPFAQKHLQEHFSGLFLQTVIVEETIDEY
jgi:hypothetical protein